MTALDRSSSPLSLPDHAMIDYGSEPGTQGDVEMADAAEVAAPRGANAAATSSSHRRLMGSSSNLGR